jgi:hypothetical protein
MVIIEYCGASCGSTSGVLTRLEPLIIKGRDRTFVMDGFVPII